ncbi:MAG: hypothetical protein ACYTGH_21420, partial [Planctomycetota bacterium]
MSSRLIILALGFMLTVSALPAATKIHISLPARPALRTHTPESRAVAALTAYLRAELARLPEVELANGHRTNMVMREVWPSTTGPNENTLYADFTRFFHTDGLVLYRAHEGSLAVYAGLKTNVASLSLPLPKTKGLLSVLHRIGTFVGKQLKLSPSAQKSLVTKRYPKAAIAETYYITSCLNSAWPVNTGESKLKALNRYRPQCRTHVEFQALVLDSVAELVASRSRDQAYAKTGLAMAPPALNFVLGTPHEHVAYRLVKHSPETLLRTLIELTEPLLKGDDLEELVDMEGEEEDLPTTSTTGLEQKITTPMRLSALRILGHCGNGFPGTRRPFDRLIEMSTIENPATRRAAAEGIAASTFDVHPAVYNRKKLLADFKKERLDLLKALADDSATDVAFVAAHALWEETGEVRPALLKGATAHHSD